MLTTKEEALEKWCPFTSVNRLKRMPGNVTPFNRMINEDGEIDYPDGARCIADRCMAWQWTDYSKTHGYCGFNRVTIHTNVPTKTHKDPYKCTTSVKKA